MQIERRARASKWIALIALMVGLGCGRAAEPGADGLAHAPVEPGDRSSIVESEPDPTLTEAEVPESPASRRLEDRAGPTGGTAAAAEPMAQRAPMERAQADDLLAARSATEREGTEEVDALLGGALAGRSGAGAPARYGGGGGGGFAGRGPGTGSAPRTASATPRARPMSPPPPTSVRSAPAIPQSGVLASTFVAGGGAQARLEDMLDRGVMVGGRHVRLEAFDDLGRLPYAVPHDDAVALYANLERERIVTSGERVHLQIALMARQGEMPARPRMDVRLVIDRSGSMHGDKWTNAIQAAHALVDRLRATDTFALISYSDDATIDLRPARVGNRRAAHAAIDRLEIGGGTNIDAALAAVDTVRPERRRPSDVLLAVLLSDGVANIGQTNPDMIASRARALFDSAGVLTTTLGVGTDFDETTMLSIAREGSGSYHFVRRSEDIARILTDELEERAQAVAQNLRLRIELAPGVTATRIYGSRVLDAQAAADVRATEIATDQRLARELGIARDRQHDDQRGLRMHLPTFRRGDQHVVLMELEVPPGTDLTQIARVSLDWKDLVHERNDSAAVDVSARRTSDAEDAIASTSRHVKRTVLAFQAGDSLQATAEALERGDHAGAQLAITERIEVLRAARDLWRDRALDADLRILEQYQQVVAAAWPGWGDDSRRTLVMAMNFYGDQRMR
ncbi:MAG: VWA domain-containing protein [Myxococcota bacterium]|nr:VWA domain-containing protein [Myxococcota bacterium]